MPTKPVSSLDGNQTLQYGFDDDKQAHRVVDISQLVPEEYDEIDIEYILAGPGTGEIGVVEYSQGGNLIATLTLSYDGSNRLINVVKS
jgi:hypothetical protein